MRVQQRVFPSYRHIWALNVARGVLGDNWALLTAGVGRLRSLLVFKSGGIRDRVAVLETTDAYFVIKIGKLRAGAIEHGDSRVFVLSSPSARIYEDV